MPPRDSDRSHILIMDDEEFIRDVAGQIMDHFGYRVSLASKGEEALEKVSHGLESGERIDLVILDLTIPDGMGARETIAPLLALDPEIKTLISSGLMDDPLIQNYEKNGFSGTIAKPYEMEEMEETIRKTLQDKHS